jgi:hypothetical protein
VNIPLYNIAWIFLHLRENSSHLCQAEVAAVVTAQKIYEAGTLSQRKDIYPWLVIRIITRRHATFPLAWVSAILFLNEFLNVRMHCKSRMPIFCTHSW